MPLNPRARLFVAAVIAAGALVLLSSARELAAGPSRASWLVLAGLGAITGSCMIKLPRIETRFSLSDALVFTSALVVGPAAAALVAAVDALAASLRFNTRDGLFVSRTLFNVTAAAVSIWLPGQAFLAASSDFSAAHLELRGVALPLVLLVAGYSLLNTGAIASVLALTAQTRVATVWRENFAWVWVAHAWSALVAGAIAIYVPHVNAFSLFVILVVGAVGYATVRVYVGKVEESTGRLHKLNDLYLATIKALALAIDAKDQVTHGHIRRVQVYAVGLARALGVDDEPTLKGIEAGALLHDTGKIAVPEHILNKPGKLTAQEYEKVKAHVTIGADILSGIDFPYPVIPYVRHHHENWDGTGYPDGLRGSDIPLGARILSVVDCFDALTSDRPYRRALTTEAAIDILRERSGTMYDPAVVDKFIAIYPELTATLAHEEPRAQVDRQEGARPATEAEAGESPEAAADADDPLRHLARLSAAGLSAAETAYVFTSRLRAQLRFSTAAVYAPSATSDDRLEPLVITGRHAEIFGRSAVCLNEGLSGWVAAHGQFIVNANPSLDLRGPAADCRIALSSALVVPFTAPSGARGALALYADAADAFTLDDARVAAAAAAHLSRALGAGGRKAAAPSARTQAA
jgi:putative nucleotidyltransferase with HDIG domain